MRNSIYHFLRECALDRISIKEGCERRGVNPGSVRKFLLKARKEPFLSRRIVKKGRHVGFSYDGVVVFWDHVKEKGKGKRRGNGVFRGEGKESYKHFNTSS